LSRRICSSGWEARRVTWHSLGRHALLGIMSVACVAQTARLVDTAVRNCVGVAALCPQRGAALIVDLALDKTRPGPLFGTVDASAATIRCLAMMRLQVQDFGGAASLLDGITTESADTRLRFLLGRTLYGLGERTEAIREWRSVPGADAYFALRGDHAYSAGHPKEARRHYEDSWDIAPTVTPGKKTMFVNRCEMSLDEGDGEDAVRWCELAVAAVDNYWTRVGLGRALYGARRLVQAEEVLRGASTLNPGAEAAFRWLGLTLCAQNRAEEGLAALRTSTMLDSSSRWAHIAYADALAARREWAPAIAQYALALELARDTPLEGVIDARMKAVRQKADASPPADQ
jgi:hypothetical protein